jgi:ABC-type Fe3+-hydroxamate transport system substrate-binding protein
MATHSFTDMIGNKVEVIFPPKCIVSLVPSQTELLYDLGLDDEVVGITKFCIHPDSWFRNKKRVGGTKTVHIDIIKSLQPDLIIANKEENTKEQILELARLYPTWVSDIRTIEDGLTMIREVGAMTGKTEAADLLAKDIKTGFSSIRQAHPDKRKRVAYFIWRNPWMCAGGDTFISNIIENIGWENVLADRTRYPEITLEELTGKEVELVLLSSEPYPFKESHIAEIKAILPHARVLLVDGEMFSWYGSRMKKAIQYLGGLLKV